MSIETISLAELKHLVKEENLLEFNRKIQQRHVVKMLQSIEQCGLLRLPVIGDISKFDKKGIVMIDGQHLGRAITLLQGEHYLKEIQVLKKVYDNKHQVIADIAKLNNTQKTWNDKEYLYAWTCFGKDNKLHFNNYKILSKLYNETFKGISLGVMIELFATSKKSFREGTLMFKNYDFSYEVASVAHELRGLGKTANTLTGLVNWCMNRKFIEHRDIDFVKLRSRLKDAIKHGRDKNYNHRDDFYEFVDTTYKKL